MSSLQGNLILYHIAVYFSIYSKKLKINYRPVSLAQSVGYCIIYAEVQIPIISLIHLKSGILHYQKHIYYQKRDSSSMTRDLFYILNHNLSSYYYHLIISLIIACRPVSGASMNPARTLGPAVVMHNYKGFWVYVLGPFIGAILGASAYNLIRFTDKPLRELSQSASFLRKGSFR
jgi:hypothetical protein